MITKVITKHIACLILCIFLSLFISLPVGAEDVPSDVIKEAEKALPIFLERISEKATAKIVFAQPTPKTKVPSQKVSFGFNETDPLDQAYLGAPFKYCLLSPDTILNYAKGSDLKSLLYQTDQWYFPVMIGKEAKTILVVAKMKGAWKAVSFGKAVLSRELAKIRQEWPIEKGYTPLLIASLQAHQFLFTIPQVDSNNLTVISLQTKKESENKDYTILEDSSSVIEALQPMVVPQYAQPWMSSELDNLWRVPPKTTSPSKSR
jgi:hypothetical protein